MKGLPVTIGMVSKAGVVTGITNDQRFTLTDRMAANSIFQRELAQSDAFGRLMPLAVRVYERHDERWERRKYS